MLVIEVDGVGMPPTLTLEGHYGLIGMRERALMIGANLSIEIFCRELALALRRITGKNIVIRPQDLPAPIENEPELLATTLASSVEAAR